MMDFEKACKLALGTEPTPSNIHTAWDFGSFFLFSFAPLYVKDGERYDTGTVFIAVDKRSGSVYDYDITSDLDAFNNAVVLIE